MDPVLALLVALLAAACGAVLALALRRPASGSITAADLMAAVGHMQSSMNSFRSDVQVAVRASDDTLVNLHKALGELTAQARQIEAVGKDVASLQDILQPPKLRGALGELMLERLLAQVLPAQAFVTQYRFRDGRTVDAIVRVQERLVPIDSKFPLEAFRRMLAPDVDEPQRRVLRRQFNVAVKGHIDAVAKYIMPDEGTLQFALMYVPAENVYYETIVCGDPDEDLRDYAYQRRVVPVSPHTLYAYLEVVALGLKGLAVEARAQQVIDQLVRLNDALGGFRQDFQVVGRHLANAQTRYLGASQRLDRLGFELARAADVPLEVAVADDGFGLNERDGRVDELGESAPLPFPPRSG